MNLPGSVLAYMRLSYLSNIYIYIYMGLSLQFFAEKLDYLYKLLLQCDVLDLMQFFAELKDYDL
jgi:hypothetical protein